MESQVAAYEESKAALIKKVVPMGGFWWQLMGHNSPVTPNTGCNATTDPKHCKPPVSEATCKAMLRRQCQPKPSSWNKMQLYSIQKNGNNFNGVTAQTFTDCECTHAMISSAVVRIHIECFAPVQSLMVTLVTQTQPSSC